ncbi:hypothetical protein GF340_03270, partial [Candidatus Peregrinibacteria bacterium]|nr:hypothetical protein [Candidatus Peregrinibacteria bacterium]
MTLENKPKSTPAEAPKQEPASQLEKDLAIDKIENKEVQDKVSAYFEQKEELKANFHEKMGNMREVLQKKVETLNKKKAYAEDFINEILQTVLE